MESIKERLSFSCESFLKGFSQVVLIENVWSGLCIFIAIFVANFELGFHASLAGIVSLFAVRYLQLDKETIRQGLYGYSPILVGIAVGLFIQSPHNWLVTIISSFFCVLVSIVVNPLFAKSSLPGLTLPFILTSWFILAMSYASQSLIYEGVPSFASPGSQFVGDLILPDLFLKGTGEIFLLDSNISSFFILIAFFVAGRKVGLLGVFAILTSILLEFLLKVEPEKISLGLYTYNLILTFLALHLFLKTTKKQVQLFLYSVAAFITFGLDMIIPTITGLLGLPSLTFPFVLSVWFVLLLERYLPDTLTS